MRNNRAGRKRTPRQNNSEPHSYTCVYVTIYIRYLTIHGTRSALCHFLLSNACVRLFFMNCTVDFLCTCICRSTMKRNKTTKQNSRSRKAQSVPRKRKQQRQRRRQRRQWNKEKEDREKKSNGNEPLHNLSYSFLFYHLSLKPISNFSKPFFALHAWISIIKITIINKWEEGEGEEKRTMALVAKATATPQMMIRRWRPSHTNRAIISMFANVCCHLYGYM